MLVTPNEIGGLSSKPLHGTLKGFYYNNIQIWNPLRGSGASLFLSPNSIRGHQYLIPSGFTVCFIFKNLQNLSLVGTKQSVNSVSDVGLLRSSQRRSDKDSGKQCMWQRHLILSTTTVYNKPRQFRFTRTCDDKRATTQGRHHRM